MVVWPVLSLLFFISSVASQTDLTLQPNAFGKSVVVRCVELIQDAAIFPPDHEMLRRLAYVETRDGETLGDGGIWKIDEGNFDQINAETFNVSSFYDEIQTAFAINWANVVYTDLNIPLYSALAARLLLAYGESQSTVISDSVSQQFDVWGFYFYSESPPITLANFTALVNELPTTCPYSQRDVVFMVDSSSVISDADFAQVKSTIRDVISFFDISNDQTRFGILQFSGIQERVLELTSGGNTTVVSSVVDGLTKQASASVLTGIAITHSLAMFSTDRGPEQGVGKLIVIITQQSSEDSTAIPLMLAAAAQTDVIAVGYTNKINQSELSNLATYNSTTHAILVANAAALSAIITTLKESICEVQVTVSTNISIQGNLSQGQSQTFEVVLSIPTSVSFFTTSGTANCYFSTTVETPTSALHDFLFTVTAPGATTTFMLNITQADTNVYFSVEGTSAGTAAFVVQIGYTPPTTTVQATTTEATTTSPNSTDTTVAVIPARGLSDGEIAGIVFACLIFVCGIIIALAYYWFTRRENLVGAAKKDERKEMDEVLIKGHENPASDETLVRKQLRIALTKDDVTGVAMALDKFHDLNLVDTDGDVIRGERLLSLHQCKDGLSYSEERRNIRYLERSIFEVKKRNFTNDLSVELQSAEVMLQDLRKIESLMERLKLAIDKNNMEAVEKIVIELKSLKGYDQATIDRMLDVYRCKGDLEQSVLNRDYDLVTRTLDVVRDRGYEFDLPVEVKRAKRMKAELDMVEEARTNVLNLKQSEVSEIRSYGSPPAGVHEVMTAVYLILGYKAYDLEEWTDIQALMGRTGRESIRRQIMDIDPRNITFEQANQAKYMIEPFDIQNVQALSNGLSMFYVFTRFMIEEVEKLNVNDLYSPTPFRTTRLKPRTTWNQNDAGKMIRR